MKTKVVKPKAASSAKAARQGESVNVQSDCPSPQNFLDEAKKEQKRILLSDYIGAIRTLREEKKFTFRAIADWLSERGIEVDHSAVYRTFLASIPEQDRNPWSDWSEVDQPGYGDINPKVKKT